MRVLVIEKAAVKQNIRVVKRRAGGAAVYGVLSGDAGGAGIAEMAELLRAEGIGRFAVSEAEEAEALRKAGFVDEEILMLRSTTDREVLERLVDLNVVCTISSVDTGLALNALAENRSTVAEAHIQVDTGMGFGGFLVGEPEKILLAYRSLPNVALSGIYTQIHAAPAGQEAEHQLQQFQRVLDAIHAAGFETGTVHAAGSYALMHCDLARMDAVRAGSVLLGRCRRTKDDGLSTVGHGEAGIAEMRWLPKGHTVGAEKTAVLKAPTRVAVVPVGYQHGFGVERPRPAGLLGTLGRWRRGRRLYCPGERPAGPGHRLCGRERDPGGCHRSEVLRRRCGLLRPGPHVRPGLCPPVPVILPAISRKRCLLCPERCLFSRCSSAAISMFTVWPVPFTRPMG